MGRLDDKVALITGGASGLGEATARRFVEEGCRVLITDLNDEAGERIAAELGSAARYCHADHTNRAENDAAVAFALETWGQLDVLHNNAGVGSGGAIDDVSEELFDDVMRINVAGPHRMTQAALPALRERARTGNASILFTCSLQTIMVRPGFTTYAASKRAVGGLVLVLALELAPDNIRVNGICPGPVDTALFRSAIAHRPEGIDAVREEFAKGLPLGRLIEPIDVANANAFLSSDEAKNISGVLLPVDGGRSAR